MTTEMRDKMEKEIAELKVADFDIKFSKSEFNDFLTSYANNGLKHDCTECYVVAGSKKMFPLQISDIKVEAVSDSGFGMYSIESAVKFMTEYDGCNFFTVYKVSNIRNEWLRLSSGITWPFGAGDVERVV